MTIIAQARILLRPRRAGRRPIDWAGHRAGSSWPMHWPGSIAALHAEPPEGRRASPDATIRAALPDLRGACLGVPPEDLAFTKNASEGLKLVASALRLKAGAARFDFGNPAGIIAAIARGEVDAARIFEPAASVILSQQGATMITSLARESFGPSHGGMRVRDAFVAQHPAAFRAEHERVHGSATEAPVRAVTARLARTVAVARPPAPTRSRPRPPPRLARRSPRLNGLPDLRSRIAAERRGAARPRHPRAGCSAGWRCAARMCMRACAAAGTTGRAC
jgi:hypothetical protein